MSRLAWSSYAYPAGSLISGAAYDSIARQTRLALDFTGEQRVKNISRPMRTYGVRRSPPL
jgi:class 3 adenylate cyclase